MTQLLSDLRHGVRVLLKAPIFTVSTVLVLALGIGATTAVFAVVYALLIEPLPYANADRLVMVWEHNLPRSRARNVISPANYLAWSERSTSFEETAIFIPTRRNLTGSGEPEELDAIGLEPTLLPMVGAQPVLGRVFATGEDQEGAAPVVILGEGFWRRRFGARPDIIGHTVRLNDTPTTVIGVLPSGFELFGLRADVYLPLVLPASAREFGGRSCMSAALLAPGVTRGQAQQELEAVFAGLVREQPDFNTGWTVNIVPLREQLVGGLRPMLLLLFGAVAAVLLIACANLINLLLARAAVRQHELALRAALGAGTGRLVRQLFTETTLLVAAGGAGGVALAWWLQVLIVQTAARENLLPLAGQVQMSGTVLGFALGTTVLTALVCGLAPALNARRVGVASTLREGGRGATGAGHARLRSGLMAAEVAIAVVLLGGAGMLVRSFIALQRVNPGFDASQVLTLRVMLSAQSPSDARRVARFHESAVERLRQVPGVQAASGTVFLPLAGMGSATSFTLNDRPEPPAGEDPVADIRPVTDGYFRTLGIPLLAGRDFEPADTADRPLVAIVNETFARMFYSGESPIGKRVTYSWDEPTTVEIIGVVGDVTLTSLDGQTRSTFYLPNQQRPLPLMTYVVHSAGAPTAIAPAAIAAIRSLDPNQPVTEVRPLGEVVSWSISQPRLTSTAVAAFALVALLLAVIGVYGVVAYGVSQRLREFGVRMALGAQPSDVLRMVLSQGMVMVLIGVVIGAALTVPLSRGMQSMLFGVEPGDPLTIAAVALLIAGVALVACYIPARRGTMVDPAITLRAE